MCAVDVSFNPFESFTMRMILLTLIGLLTLGALARAQVDVAPEQMRAIAREAYVWGYPLVDDYRVSHFQAIDRNARGFKAPINVLANKADVTKAGEQTVQTPNSDTPYSNVVMALRAEPIVLTIPAIEEKRYFSIQLIDAYTHNFAYIGTRATGNGGGSFLIAGPDWTGATPPGIAKVIRCETSLAKATYRTQLFNPADIENIRALQAQYKVQTLSQFLNRPAPPAAPAIDWPAPIELDGEPKSHNPQFWSLLNFKLQFCPVHESEVELRARLARIGIEAGRPFAFDKLSPDQQQAIRDGVADAWKEFAGLSKRMDAGEVTSADAFGTREHLKNNYLLRWGGDVVGIYGNSAEEAIYPMYSVDAEGAPLDAAKSKYVLRFEPGKFPPVNAFWSVTMYSLPDRYLVANPIDRTLINSPMLPDLKLDADGGLTIYIQHDSPGKEKESNWLPAPNGPFFMAMRLYWPREEALNGAWKVPPLKRD
jgi:hypothetical protein